MSGPSGVGKSSVVHELADRIPFHFSVSWTTRERRPGEVEGIDYVYVDRPRFERAIAEGRFLEWAEYSGYLYGTPRDPVLGHLEAGENVILDIENDGARQVKSAYPDAVLIFVLPPTRSELERRLRNRGDTSEEDIQRRLAVADRQIADAEASFDYLVVNDDLATAVDDIVSILSAAS